MGALSVFRKVLVKLGLKKLKSTVLVVGLQNSGKSTIVNNLKDDANKVAEITPTVGFSVEQVQLEKCKLTIVDLSGDQKYHKLWSCYYEEAQAIIFVIDATDRGSLEEAKGRLMEVVLHDHLQKIPLLVFANKSDVATALSQTDVMIQMDLKNSLHAKKSWLICASSGITGDGLQQGMKWLTDLMKYKKQKKR
mmetsp:Transcript_15874/g.26802  ORF Transcript_15874/g.26802 Transcript_15874/m.26802 type:complete len:193 (+) Transcript_15874:256-834(+)|eukprot:CAMPEP_0198216124 /NCGR_PEP_ID=MMETSP1445-20131203/55064_1 /TAXON_ID=36898 /ORGANISM="Pyramimonas sp., Strain CCMP2087" /LENGTH=192 /DNA_ID=CAMNT_0043892217 /DNA_START=166 /DNA_END=744 /DNA_ORIENTATION=-